MRSIKKCPYYYHTPTNPFDVQCYLDEGHVGEHLQPQLITINDSKPNTGWIKHVQ